MRTNEGFLHILTSVWVWGVAIQIPSAAVAQSSEPSSIGLYASAENCRVVLQEINQAEPVETDKLELASQICFVSRLSEHLARETSRLAVPLNDNGTIRSLDEATSDRERESIIAIEALKSKLDISKVHSERLLREVTEADPHETNDLLRRLLGSPRDSKG